MANMRILMKKIGTGKIDPIASIIEDPLSSRTIAYLSTTSLDGATTDNVYTGASENTYQGVISTVSEYPVTLVTDTYDPSNIDFNALSNSFNVTLSQRDVQPHLLNTNSVDGAASENVYSGASENTYQGVISTVSTYPVNLVTDTYDAANISAAELNNSFEMELSSRDVLQTGITTTALDGATSENVYSGSSENTYQGVISTVSTYPVNLVTGTYSIGGIERSIVSNNSISTAANIDLQPSLIGTASMDGGTTENVFSGASENTYQGIVLADAPYAIRLADSSYDKTSIENATFEHSSTLVATSRDITTLSTVAA